MKRTKINWLGTGVLSSAVRRGAKHAFFLAVLTASASAAFGAATYSTEDNGATLVVTVEADSATLDASQIVAGVTKIRKAGTGRLVSTDISSFTGDIDITEGIWCATDSGHFGATSTTAPSGTVDVRDGASIEYAGTNANPGCLSGKTVNLYGKPASGGFARNDASGKIVLSKGTLLLAPGLGSNMSVNLVDSDTLFWSSNRLRITGTLNLGGHKLTLRNGAHDLGGFVTNGGVLSIYNWTTLMTEGTNLVFAADCAANAYVEIGFDATLNLKSVRTVANGWTLRNNGGSMTSNQKRTYTDPPLGAWDGPVVFTGDSNVANYSGSESIPTTVFDLFGDLSGESGSLKIGPGWLNLHSAVNTYAGAVTVTSVGNAAVPAGAGGIGIFGGAPCFPNASSITLNDSARLAFMDDVAAHVGKIAFTGGAAQSIEGGSAEHRSTIAGLTKTGANTLVVDTPAHFTGPATIGEGVLKIPYRSVRGTPGLLETHLTPVSPGDPEWDDAYVWAGLNWNGTDNKWPISRPWLENYRQHLNYDDKGVCEIGPRRGVSPMINNSNCSPHWSDGYSGGRNGWWYRGYVWNNSNEPVTYTFWSGLPFHAAAIYFGTEHDMLFFPTATSSELYNEYSVEPAAAKSYTLQPGATPIDIIVWGEGGSSTLWSYSLPTTGERHGIVFAPSSVCTAESLNAQIVAFYNAASTANTNAVRDTLRRFSAFKDESGIGNLFTADVYGEGDAAEITELLPVFDDLRFENGATIDLDGNIDFAVKNLAGSPTVVNAVKMTVTNCWTVCASDFPKADASVRRPLTIDGQLAFAAGAKVAIDDDSRIERSTSGIVVATAVGGIVGKPVAADGRWKVVVRGNDVVLQARGGLMLILR